MVYESWPRAVSSPYQVMLSWSDYHPGFTFFNVDLHLCANARDVAGSTYLHARRVTSLVVAS